MRPMPAHQQQTPLLIHLASDRPALCAEQAMAQRVELLCLQDRYCVEDNILYRLANWLLVKAWPA